jgi:hypothetical protein
MARKDIIVAIKNAVERGYSFEQAKQVLINSGYNIKDINDAYNYLTGGIGEIQENNFQNTIQNNSLVMPIKPINTLQTNNLTPNQNINYDEETVKPIYPPLPIETSGEKKPFPWTVVFLSTLLIILVISLILVLLFKDNIAAFLQNLFK